MFYSLVAKALHKIGEVLVEAKRSGARLPLAIPTPSNAGPVILTTIQKDSGRLAYPCYDSVIENAPQQRPAACIQIASFNGLRDKYAERQAKGRET